MILTVKAIDDEQTLRSIREAIDTLGWRDGRATAGRTAKAMKRNEQAVLDSAAGRDLREKLLATIKNNPVVQAFARPRRITPIMISRTSGGGHYGAHVDNAIMGSGSARLRTDTSFTLFLNAPAEYEGGELVVHAAGAISRIKAQAGELVLYPSTSIHEVAPVTTGQRIAAVGWIESLVPDPAQREVLFDLENLRASLRGKPAADTAELLTLDKSIANLVRMWARP